MTIVLCVLALLIILVLFSGLYVFLKACVRSKEILWLVEEEIKKTGFAQYYPCILASNEWLKEHHAQDVSVMSNDGLKLCGFWIPAENPRGTILLAHGYRSTFLVDFGLAFAFYHALGMNILVPYQRSHGVSQGRYITFGVKESDDMKCWIGYHNRTFGCHQMILSGLSMGASTVLFLADQDLPDNVKCIIADCGFSSPQAILDAAFRSVVHLPAKLSLTVTNLLTHGIAGFGLNQKDTRVILKNAKLPVMMIHGLADDFVPSDMTVQGYQACRSEKEILLVEGAGHGVSFLKDKETYTKRVIAFLEKHLEDF